KVAGNHLVVCREAPDGKFEVREYNSFKNRIEVPLERCETMKEAEGALDKYSEVERTMTDFNSLRERQRHFEGALREARSAGAGFSGATPERRGGIGKTFEVGR